MYFICMVISDFGSLLGWISFYPMCYENETIKIMEGSPEHDFGSIWLVEVPCTADKKYSHKETSEIGCSMPNKIQLKKPTPPCYSHEKTSCIPVLPLLFVRASRNGPLRVRNPIRYNRRNLSQPCRKSGSVRRSEAIFHISNLVPLSLWYFFVPGTFSVKPCKCVLSSSLLFSYPFVRVAQEKGDVN